MSSLPVSFITSLPECEGPDGVAVLDDLHRDIRNDRPRLEIISRFSLLFPLQISATILTKNSAARLDEVLAALWWCDEVVILDTGSSDDTLAIARRHRHTRIHHLPGSFPGFGLAHQAAVALARNDWILSIDSDEVISLQLVTEIARLKLCPETVYTMPFHNHFNGRHITSCGWHPDRHERLFNRRYTNFCGSAVHEKVQTQHLKLAHLQAPIHHYSYAGVDDFLRKMRDYSTLFAVQNAKVKTASPVTALSHGLWAFFKSYWLQRGFLEGYEGLVISAYKAQTTFWKYLFLYEANWKALTSAQTDASGHNETALTMSVRLTPSLAPDAVRRRA